MHRRDNERFADRIPVVVRVTFRHIVIAFLCVGIEKTDPVQMDFYCNIPVPVAVFYQRIFQVDLVIKTDVTEDLLIVHKYTVDRERHVVLHIFFADQFKIISKCFPLFFNRIGTCRKCLEIFKVIRKSLICILIRESVIAAQAQFIYDSEKLYFRNFLRLNTDLDQIPFAVFCYLQRFDDLILKFRDLP